MALLEFDDLEKRPLPTVQLDDVQQQPAGAPLFEFEEFGKDRVGRGPDATKRGSDGAGHVAVEVVTRYAVEVVLAAELAV